MSRQGVALQFAHRVEIAQLRIGVLGHHARQHGLILRGDVRLQHHDVIKALRAGVQQQRLDRHAQRADEVVVGRKHHRHQPGLVGLTQRGAALRLAEQHTGHLPDDQLRAGFALVVDKNAGQALGQMAGGAVAFHRIMAHVRPLVKLLQQVKQPLGVFLEQLFAHHKHIAVIAAGAVQIPTRRLAVFGALLVHELKQQVQILLVQAAALPVVVPDAGVELRHFGYVHPVGHHNVRPLDHFAGGGLIQTVLGNVLLADVLRDHIAVDIFLRARGGKAEIAAVVAEAVVIRLHVFPGPVLHGHLTIGAILVRNILAGIVPVKLRVHRLLRQRCPAVNRMINALRNLLAVFSRRIAHKNLDIRHFLILHCTVTLFRNGRLLKISGVLKMLFRRNPAAPCRTRLPPRHTHVKPAHLSWCAGSDTVEQVYSNLSIKKNQFSPRKFRLLHIFHLFLLFRYPSTSESASVHDSAGQLAAFLRVFIIGSVSGSVLHSI